MIQLKGYKAGLIRCIIPDDMSERQLLEEFSKIVEEGKSILDGSEVLMEMQKRNFSPSLITKIWKAFVEPSNCTVSAWICDDEETKYRLSRLGIKVEADEKHKTKQIVTENRKSEQLNSSYIHTGNLRGGQKIEHDGDVFVLGHVHMGSEIFANGNITVFGRLQGLVHAGCSGDNSKAVFVRALESGQVRIGTKAGIIDTKSSFWGKPVVVSLNKAEEVLVADWPSI